MSNPIPITVLIVSHDKPLLLPEAIASVLGQTFTNWQGILVDSGVLYDEGFFGDCSWKSDTRLRIVRSAETAALRRRKAMAPWCFNECLRRGWAQGELIVYLCDDDIFYPEAFGTFVEAFRKKPEAMAMYGSQDLALIRADGKCSIVGERRALAPGGKSCNGRIMDCQVDYLQLCHRRAALNVFADEEYWPEDRATCDHADGLFMEKLGSFWPILPIDVKIGQNRRTPWSLNLSAAVWEDQVLRADGLIEWEDRPVHESIMDAWMAMRQSLESDDSETDRDKAMATFQAQLRKLCEQDHALRRRLVSRRYRLVDKVYNLVRGVARRSRNSSK